MNLRRVKAIAKKEIIQVWRDPRSLMVVLLMPLMQMALLGYGVNLDIKHVPICVFDREGSQESESLMKAFQASPYFDIVETERDYNSLKRAIDARTLQDGDRHSARFLARSRDDEFRASAGDSGRDRRQHRQYRARLCAGGGRDVLQQRSGAADCKASDSSLRIRPRSRNTGCGSTRISRAATSSSRAWSRSCSRWSARS